MSLVVVSPPTVKRPRHGLVVHVYEKLHPPQYIRVLHVELPEMAEAVNLLVVDMVRQAGWREHPPRGEGARGRVDHRST